MFISRYRHRPSDFGQQNKGYAVRGLPVNRHGMYYGMFYGPSVPDFQPISEIVPEPIWKAWISTVQLTSVLLMARRGPRNALSRFGRASYPEGPRRTV